MLVPSSWVEILPTAQTPANPVVSGLRITTSVLVVVNLTTTAEQQSGCIRSTSNPVTDCMEWSACTGRELIR